MDLKKIGHWILFLIGGFIGTWIVLRILVILPLVGMFLFELGNFWFVLIGAILFGLYNYLVIFGLNFFYTFLNKKKPDYWMSNIFLILVAFFVFYNLINDLREFFNEFKGVFFKFKFVFFSIGLLPAYLRILFFAFLIPFRKEND